MRTLPLIPMPQKIRYRKAEFHFTPDTRIFVPAGIEDTELSAAFELSDCIGDATGVAPTIDRLGRKAEKTGVFLSLERKKGKDPESYSLDISARKIELTAPAAPGLFYGLQTLIQLATAFGTRLPALSIQDCPDFPNRGFYLDVTRGKVPTIETLLELAGHLAHLKTNQMQLYVEHTFAFRFDADIARGCSPLTADEILALDAYCAGLHIDLVPSIQSFGHMGHILSLPKYRSLGEIEINKCWEEMSWHERMVGTTFDPSNPKSLKLLENIFDNFLPLFRSKYVNVCCDETWALGKGKNKKRAEALGEKGGAVARWHIGAGSTIIYLEFMEKINKLCKKHKKKMMFWGDIVIRHPQLIGRIPKDTILLNWGYGAKHNVDNTKEFTKRKFETCVCPGTSGWNRIMNGVENAEVNIRRFAAAGKKYGAIGVLNTDWGDHGHYNLLANSFHGMALGAAAAWNGKGSADKKGFDKAFSFVFFGDRAGRVMKAVRKVSWASSSASTWIMFYKPFKDAEASKGLTTKQAERLQKAGPEAAAEIVSLINGEDEAALDLLELAHACEMSGLLGTKMLLSHRVAEAPKGKKNKTLARALKRFADTLSDRLEDYVSLWRARNKESNLRDIIKILKERIKEAHTLARRFG